MSYKQIILCADDFAQSEMISLGILSLTRHHRINALSCLVNMPFWAEAHAELEDFKSNRFIGLHLNMTFGQPMSAAWRGHYGDEFGGLSKLIKSAYCHQLDLAVVTAEIQAQIDVFTQDMHVYPDFIDGHQHIHQLPVIRKALLSIYQKQYEKLHGFTIPQTDGLDSIETTNPFFLRKTYNGWRDFLSIQGFPKSQALALLGGITWQRKLMKAQVATNSSFAGIYGFNQHLQYRRYFKSFLGHISEGGLIMCHPGYPSDDHSDPIYSSRHHELNYLMSDDFLQDLEDYSVCFMHKEKIG